MVSINVSVDEILNVELEAEAREQGVTASEIIRRVLQEHLRSRKPRESCLDIARRIGIVGVYKETPTDLSTNPAHMEGFGVD